MFNRRIADELAAGRAIIEKAKEEARTSAPLLRGNAANTSQVISPDVEANASEIGDLSGGGWAVDPDTQQTYWALRVDIDATNDDSYRLA